MTAPGTQTPSPPLSLWKTERKRAVKMEKINKVNVSVVCFVLDSPRRNSEGP